MDDTLEKYYSRRFALFTQDKRRLSGEVAKLKADVAALKLQLSEEDKVERPLFRRISEQRRALKEANVANTWLWKTVEGQRKTIDEYRDRIKELEKEVNND